MRTRLETYRNSAFVRIPTAVLKAVGLSVGEPVEVRAESGVIVIGSLRRREYSLNKLVDQIKPRNLHEEIELGARAGQEIW